MKKSLIIKEEIHTMLKEYCDNNGMKMHRVIENLIIKYIKNEEKNTK
jgi:hypothetical protein